MIFGVRLGLDLKRAQNKFMILLLSIACHCLLCISLYSAMTSWHMRDIFYTLVANRIQIAKTKTNDVLKVKKSGQVRIRLNEKCLGKNTMLL